MKASIIGWVVAAVLGAALALTGQRLLDAPDRTPAGPDTTAKPAPPPPPEPVDPSTARSTAVATLVGLGVPHGAIEHGVYPLRGPGRATGDTLPLVSFTCPADRGCASVLARIEQDAAKAGLTLVQPVEADRPGRPLFRALADGAHPALALRALPSGPRLTVIIGDVGREPALLDAVLGLDPDVTLSVMANAPTAERVAARLVQDGREVLAHLPMEPAPPETADGGDFLTTAQTPEAVAAAAAALLARVPGAAGVDPHMGSRLTASRPHMAAVLDVLADEGLFFVDSGGSVASVALPTARSRGVRARAPTHDLDRDERPLAARLKAVEVSLVLDGRAVVTASPDPETLAALKPWIETLRSRRIHVLRASEIVR